MIQTGICMVCKKGIPTPLMICFECSSTRKAEVLMAIEKLAMENMERKSRPKSQETKKQLENKIKELEGKLSKLSEHLGETTRPNEEPYKESLGDLYRRSIYDKDVNNIIKELDTPQNFNEYANQFLGSYKREKTSSTRGSMPKGFPSINESRTLKEYEDRYEEKLKQSRGTMPKGFTSGTMPRGFGRTSFSKISLRTKKEGRRLYDQEKCVSCEVTVKYEIEKHYVLCRKCTDELQSSNTFNNAMKVIKRWGLKDKKNKQPLMKKLMIKLKLAEKQK